MLTVGLLDLQVLLMELVIAMLKKILNGHRV